MASIIRISNTSDLRRKASELEELNGSFREAVTNLRADETQLTSSYEGDAQKIFHEQFSEDMQLFDNFYAVINLYIQQIRTDADIYDKTEERNKELARNRK